MRILQLYYKMPFPLHDGGAFSIYAASQSMLRAGIELKVLAMNPLKENRNNESIPIEFREATRFESVVVDNRIKPATAVYQLLVNKSYMVSRFVSDDFRNRLTTILKNEDFDLILLEHLYLCSYIHDIRKNSAAKVVLRTQNVESHVWFEYCRRLKNPLLRFYLHHEARQLKKMESATAKQLDGLVALTDIDADYFRRLNDRLKIAVIPVGIDKAEDSFATDHDTEPDYTFLYHLGSMDWRPNTQGLQWFVGKVLPLVISRRPEIQVWLAGKKMSSWFFSRSNQNLHVDGLIHDIQAFHKDKPIMIVPLLSGSGIRVKILEGMALGKTVISTSTGARGIKAINNENILIADSPEEFAEQICRCADSPALCKEIGKNGKKLVSENYSLEITGKQLTHFFHQLLQKTNSEFQSWVQN